MSDFWLETGMSSSFKGNVNEVTNSHCSGWIFIFYKWQCIPFSSAKWVYLGEAKNYNLGHVIMENHRQVPVKQRRGKLS